MVWCPADLKHNFTILAIALCLNNLLQSQNLCCFQSSRDFSKSLFGLSAAEDQTHYGVVHSSHCLMAVWGRVAVLLSH